MARGVHLAPATRVSQWLLRVPVVILLLLPLLASVVLSAKAPSYEFQLDLYDHPLPWQKCPEGWRRHGKKCYKLFTQHVSWGDANKVCKSLGGCLANIRGFNQNEGLGKVLQQLLAEQQSQTSPSSGRIVQAATADSHQVWIGFKRDGGGDYSWSNGSPGFKQQGFWDTGSPPTFSNSIDVHEQCCDINLNSTEVGSFRWNLGGCDRKRVFVCETKACNKRHFRCADGRKCVSEKSICDGDRDCDDGSDERQCGNDASCGGSLSGEKGTFHSPGYPRKYPKHAACMWRVQAPLGTKVQLQFESFDIERKYDSVEVYDGSEREASALLGRYNGKHIPVVSLATSNFLLVILTSDRSKEADGFNATWSAVTFDGETGACGGELRAQHSVQWFTSPLYPSPYPDNLVCDWIITASSPNDIINLQFQDFDLENTDDWMEVRSGQTDGDPLLGRFSGPQPPRVIVSAGSSLFVRLKTDFSHSLDVKGFNVTYSTGCDIDISSGVAKIESPGYGAGSYPSNVDCSWRIADPGNRQLNLVFDSAFDTEPTMDVVRVYNSSQGSSSHLAAELSGSMSPPPCRSKTSAYTVHFSSDATVQRSGWSATVSFDCAPLRIERPLEIDSSAVVFGTVVHYQCEDGYILQGTNFTVCDVKGLWQPDALRTCQLIDCGSPEVPKHSYLVSMSGTTYGETTVYNCSKGYFMEGGVNISTCGQEGWSLVPKCEVIYCPKEPPPLHGSAMAEDNTFGALREFFCNKGFRLEGAKFSYCTAQGEWTYPVPECHLLQCPGIAGIIHGSPEPEGPVSVGETVRVTCMEGYQLEGHGNLTCTTTLDYDHPVPYCRDLDECEMEGTCAEDGHHTCQNVVGSYRCLCEPGYQHPHDDSTLCQDIDECLAENGGCTHNCSNFAGSYECSCHHGYTLYLGSIAVVNGGQLVPNKTCIAPCEALRVSGGTVAYTRSPIHGGLYLHPTQAIIACPVGDVPDGPARLTCLEEGGWSGFVNKCEATVCPFLDTPVNGQVSFSGQTLGGVATYTCDSGFRLSGPGVRFCQLHKDLETSEQKLMWTGPQPSCYALDCGPPPEPENGVVFFTSSTVSSVATYSCRCGYQLDGDSVRTCLTSGLWSGNNTQCNAQACPHPGRPVYGSMLSTEDTFPVGAVVHLQCDRPGYSLSDPWPMECLSPPSYQVSPVLPLYRVSLTSNFVTANSSNVTAPCGTYYQGVAVRLMRKFVRQLQLECVSLGQPMISVNNKTDLEITGHVMRLTGWYEMTSRDREDLRSSCRCGQAIASRLSTVISSIPSLMLDASHELSCVPAFLQKESVDTSEQGWTCPLGLGLQAVDGQCGQGVPACMEACVSDTPTTTTSPVVSTITPSTATTTMTTTTTTLTIITIPTLPPSPSTTITTTTSTTTTTTHSFASSTYEGDTTESTIKDITMGSTTVSPPTVAGSSSFPVAPADPPTVAWPLFLIEVEDKMEGSFTNITCIDEVHLDINSKVNEVMRDFIALIGHTVCLNASDVTLELKSGNIRFRGAKARIFIQFSLKYRSSHPESVESCASEFKVHLLQELPQRFQRVSEEVVPSLCTELTYVRGDTNVTRSSWDCPKGYQLEVNLFVCQRISSTPFSSLPSATPTPSATAPPTPVNTIPRMTLTFQATFTQVTHRPRHGMEACISEYNAGLMGLLRDLESHVQSRDGSCPDIYVDITRNLSLAVHGSNTLKATAQVMLLPMAKVVTLPDMHRCAGYITSRFRSPEKHLPNVTLPGSYLHNCSSIVLNPAELTSDGERIVFSCAERYVYDAFNFLCIDETRPSHKVEIDMTIEDLAPHNKCRKAVEAATKWLSQQVVEDTHSRLYAGRLCNVSTVGDRVVQLPRNSALSLDVSRATISIPFVLLSIHGESAPVEKCRALLYSHLALSLGDPVISMMRNVTRACPDAVAPLNYTRAAEEWGCFVGRVYNAQTHSCDKFGALEESITKTKGLMSERRRRDTRNEKDDIRPYWNTSLPACQDREPPAFQGCPKTSIEVNLGGNGPVPATFTLPTVSDNSGGALTVTYQPPEFRLPYTFRENMTVNMTAVDPAGNRAVCRISVKLLDVTPPKVQCPRGVYRHHYSSEGGSTVAVVYPAGVVNATDYGGISHTVYDPLPGTMKEVLKMFNVTATVLDFSGNAASCSFSYIAGTNRCALWELPIPADGQGQRSCSSDIKGSVGFGKSCQVSCPRDYDFISPPPSQYVCFNGSTWYPNNSVPQCGALFFTNFDFNLTLNFTYEGEVSGECLERVNDDILSELRPFFVATCANLSQSVNLTITHMAMKSGPFFVLKMRVSIILKSGVTNAAAKKCGTQILANIDEFNPKVAVDNCFNATFLPPSESQGEATCFPGFAHVGESCLECPSGSYMDADGKRCEHCPIGQYQNASAQIACELCPNGSHTLLPGARSQAQCLEFCPAGSYSATGLSPCHPCPVGEHQSAVRQTSCQPCDDGYSTVSEGAASSADCKRECWTGYYSSTGLAPCTSCPMHHYSDVFGATACTQCPPDKSNVFTASKSSGACLVTDWCSEHQCAEGSTCVDQHRFYQCLCPPGFTGARCNMNIDECASLPCVNGGTCEDNVNSFTCQCGPGYEGGSCETETNECLSNPCVHGVCVDKHLDFTCHCYNGYTGTLCDTEIDDCAAAPCKNGGRCLDLVAGYLCDCSGTGHEGATCEENINDCSDSSCLNGGSCNDLVSGSNCTCSPGFRGEKCEVDIDECRPDPCTNHALCLDGVNSFHCVCEPGYTGEQCRTDINECASSPCDNAGSCTDLVNDYLCTCLPGYEGRNCEIDVDDCVSSPCSAEGTEWCQDDVNTFTCHCLTLWEGELCDTQADPCLTNPCSEGATCTAVEDNFVCTCLPDFTGTLCDHHVDDCESGPCMNNGTCLDDVHSFSCECGQGLTGQVCDVNVDECLSQPCANGATCRDLINGYTCSCAAGFEGEGCDEHIDDCGSLPCAHGGTCSDLVNDFECLCNEGYTGKSCNEDVDECEVSPCKNGGTCINLEGSFYCECPAGYRGDTCEHDPCSFMDSCLNNATCVSQPGGITCHCPAEFTGADCGKEKSGDFDLQFHGKGNASCRPPDLVISPDARLAVCLWLRYGSPNARSTVLTLAKRSGSAIRLSDNSDNIMLDLTGDTLSVSLQGEREPSRFAVSVTDGRWHHVCYQWAGSHHAVYVDGGRTVHEYKVETSLPHRVSLIIGQPSSATGERFQGEISQCNVFSSALSDSQIMKMGGNCSEVQESGDVYDWRVSDAYLTGEVTVVTPALCGDSQCPPGFSGTYCNIESDKTAPAVVSCPDDQTVTDTTAMVTVKWEEPEFDDNVGIVSIQQTHRSGQAFRHGEYVVTYVAYDAENNSAECSFEVIVKPFNCVEPPAPVYGGKVCQTWLHGSFCSVACFPTYTFVELPPPFYTCGKLGFWDPPRGSPFRFPPCTLMYEPEVSLVGTVDVTGPGCTEEFRLALRTKFSQIMTELDALLGLCKTDFCDFENSFSVTCDRESTVRSKRETTAHFRVAISLDVAANSSALQKSNSNWAADEVVTALKQGRFNDNVFTADSSSAHLSVDYLCEPGQVLRVLGDNNVTRTCVDCPAGYFYNSTAADCELCAEGSYSDKARQFQCQLCPERTTTNARGSTGASDCFEVCTPGSYYSMGRKQCVLCPTGQYQDGTGQTSCLNCPTGQSTERPGATAVGQCGNVCELGQELSGDGQCQLCPVGSYQDSRDAPLCVPCPYGWSTPSEGATSIQECSAVVCERGHYWISGNECEPCPAGTYQPSRGSDRCIACGVGLTTASTGAVSKTQCHSGPVDECSLGTDRCDSHATCVDAEIEYNCVCRTGFIGDGFNCTDLCENFCDNGGECGYKVNGDPFCNCRNGFTGPHCQEEDILSEGINSAVAGGIAGSVVAVFVIVIVTGVCFWRHRTQRKKSNDRIYRSRQSMAPAAFYNEGYESIRDNMGTPSQLIVREQSSSTSSSSSLSIAPRWNRSTFANSDEVPIESTHL